MTHSRTFRVLFVGSMITGIVGMLAISAWLLLWPVWLWYHIPRFSDMNEKEIETYVRNRMLASGRLEAVVVAPGTSEGPETVTSTHIITDPERIQRLAQKFRVLQKKERFGPVAASWYIDVLCDEKFGMMVLYDEVFLPIPNDEWGSFVVRVDWSFLEELGDLLEAARPMTDWWRSSSAKDSEDEAAENERAQAGVK